MYIPSPLWKRLFGLAILAAIATAAAAALVHFSTPVAPPADTAPAAEQNTTAPQIHAPHAYVGAWDGRLAVFRTKGAAPDEVFDVFIASLPASEQEALAAGIPVFDEEELQRLLEDYTG